MFVVQFEFSLYNYVIKLRYTITLTIRIFEIHRKQRIAIVVKATYKQQKQIHQKQKNEAKRKKKEN